MRSLLRFSRCKTARLLKTPGRRKTVSQKARYAATVFPIMIAEVVFMAVSVLLGVRLAAGFDFSKYQPAFLVPAIPIFLMLAILPNLLLFKEENQRFSETISKVRNIWRAVSIGLVTPVCFAILIALVAY